MAEFPREIEIQRVMNLVQGFGWVKVKEELRDRDLILTVKKTFIEEEDLEASPAPS